jgi:hypothetical protein
MFVLLWQVRTAETENSSDPKLRASVRPGKFLVPKSWKRFISKGIGVGEEEEA